MVIETWLSRIFEYITVFWLTGRGLRYFDLRVVWLEGDVVHVFIHRCHICVVFELDALVVAKFRKSSSDLLDCFWDLEGV
jgi:hypothetical protein